MNKVINNLNQDMEAIKGKTIAIVYIFEGDNSSGFEHFFIWKSNVITKWMNAVQNLHCMPLILDVRTFVDKAINNTLPNIDYVLNLNSGTYNLSSMALVPSTCSSIGIPCIPCDSIGIITGENKNLSNLIANSIGLNVPYSLDTPSENGIYRPINLGNSLGVEKGIVKNIKFGIYQEFIQGYDLTTPIVYNPIKKSMQLLPTVIFIPDNNDQNWFISEDAKHTRNGFQPKIIKLCNKLETKLLELADTLSIQTFCRVDTRLKCTNSQSIEKLLTLDVELEDLYFIEINTMPTIRENNSFSFSYSSILPSDKFSQVTETMKQVYNLVDLHSFLLVNSILSFIKSKY